MPLDVSPLTAEEYQRLIVSELDMEGNTKFVSLLPTWWRSHNDRGAVSLRLQYLYVMVDSCRYIQKGLRSTAVDWTEQTTAQKNSQRMSNISKILADTRNDIQILQTELNRAGSNFAASGEIKTKTIRPARSGYPDPNDVAFRGDPEYQYPGEKAAADNAVIK